MLPGMFAVKKTERLQSDSHGSRRDHELFGKRPGELLKHLIVTTLVETVGSCRPRFINIAQNDDSISSPKNARMIVAESIPPSLNNQLARHQQARSI